MSVEKRRHIHQFDAIRGIAALAVMLSHYVLIFDNSSSSCYKNLSSLIDNLSYSPLGVFWAGRSAVLLFFVLSGYVLFVMINSASVNYIPFLLKRGLRLYIPYLFAVFLGIVGEYLLYHGKLSGLNPWVNQFWSGSITTNSIFDLILFIDAFNTNRYDFTIWTLVQEMRISILFPAILLFMRGKKWWISIVIFFTVSILSMACRILALSGWQLLPWLTLSGSFTAYIFTPYYIFAFVLGATLASQRKPLQKWYSRLSTQGRITVFIIGFSLYYYGPHFVSTIGIHHLVVRDWPAIVGAAILLVVSAYDMVAIKTLTRPVFLYFGKISYSLYLLHAVVLLAMLHAFYGVITLPVLLPLSIGVTFLISDLAYRFVESPAINISRAVPRRFKWVA